MKTRDSADDFDRAKQACMDRAMAATATAQNDALATKAALGVYLKCMEEKGWVSTEQPAPREP